MDNNQQNFGGAPKNNMGQMPPRPLSTNQPPVPPRPVPPPPPPPMRDFQHVAPVAPSGITPKAPSPAGAPELKTPQPPGPEINIRTLQSDTQSLAASGGAAPQAQTIKLEDLEDDAPIFSPGTVSNLPTGVGLPPRPSKKMVIAVVGSVVGVLALGLLGYYVAYPLIFAPTPATKPVTQVTPPPKPQPLPHTSLFATAPPLQQPLTLNAVDATAISTALRQEAKNAAAPQTVKELSFANAGGQVPFGAFMNALVPEIAAPDIKALLADDFTAFLYYDENGVWPGYVATLKPSAIPSDVQATFARLEVADLGALYVDSPGTKGEFKSGQLNGVPTRYAAFPKPGASFNYGIFGNYLIVSTSFTGLKAALPFLPL